MAGEEWEVGVGEERKQGRKGGRRAITNDLTPDGRGSLSGEIRIVNFFVRQRAEL